MKMKKAIILSVFCCLCWTTSKGNVLTKLNESTCFENVNKIQESDTAQAIGKITFTLDKGVINIIINSPDIKITDLKLRFYDKKNREMSGGKYDKTLLKKYNKAKVNKSGFQSINQMASGKIAKKSRSWTLTIKTSDGKAYQVTKKIRGAKAIKDQLIINFEKTIPCDGCFE